MKEDSLARSPNTSVTRIKFRKNMKDSFDNTPAAERKRDNSNESLERIHTFSLKNSFSKTNTALEKDSSTSNMKPLLKSTLEKIPNLQLNKGSTLENPHKTYYVEESVRIIENIIMKADPILSELATKVK